jgi:hypothetical protein
MNSAIVFRGVTLVGLRPPSVPPRKRQHTTPTGRGSTYQGRKPVQTKPATAKVAADCEPTLKVNPLRKTRERVEHALGVPGDVLCEQLGASAFRQWFTQVRCEAAVGDTVKLSAPSKFVRKWLITNYEHAIVACWQKTHSRAIERVEITVRS